VDDALFAQAMQATTTTAQQRRALQGHLGPDEELDGVLWAALREGRFVPRDDGWWWTMRKSDAYDAADALALLASAEGGPIEAKYREGCSWNLLNALTTIDHLIEGAGEAEMLAGRGQVGGFLGALLRYLLAQRGHIVPVEESLIPHLTQVVVCAAGDSDLTARVEAHFGGAEAVWAPGVWRQALLARLFKQMDDPGQSVRSYRGLGIALDAMSHEELVSRALVHCYDERAEKQRVLDRLRARGTACLPALLALGAAWRADQDARHRRGHTLNILVSATLLIQHDAGLPLLDAEDDLLIQHAMWDRQGPLQDVLQLLPIERLEPLMFPRRASNPYTYFHHCPTEAVRRHMVEQIRALGDDARWEYTNEIPFSIVKIGAPMLPLLHDALRVGGGLHRHILLRCLADIGDPSSVATLIAAFSDDGPRFVQDHDTNRFSLVKDIPERAADALMRLAMVIPEEALVPPLTAALGHADQGVRRRAAEVLATLPITPAVAAVRAALPQEDRRVSWLLQHTLNRAPMPEALSALLARAEESPTAAREDVAATMKEAWRDGAIEALWVRQADHPAAVLVGVTRRYLAVLIGGGSLFGVDKPWWKTLTRFAAHPAAAPLALDVLDRAPRSREYEVRQSIEALRDALPTLAADYRARCTADARPATWRTTYLFSSGWGLPIDELLIDGLIDDNPEVRSLAGSLLRSRPASNLPRVYPQLGSRSKALRHEAAALLQHFPVKEAIPHLLAARKSERAKAVRAALDEALSAYSAADIAAAPVLAQPRKRAARKKKAAAPVTVRAAWTDWLAHTPLTTPSSTAWDQLTGQIEQLPPNAAEAAALAEALDGWPDALRVAPVGWVGAASRKACPPHWSLARSIVWSRFGSTRGMTPARVKWMFTSERMARITSLTLAGMTQKAMKTPIVAHLAGSTHLSGLRGLHLSTCWMGLELMDALGAATHLTKLESLTLSNNMLSPSDGHPGITALLEMPHLRSLKALEAHQCGSQHLIEAMGSSSGLPALERLHIAHWRAIDASHVAAVAGIDRPWRWIALNGQGVNAAVAEAYARSEYLGRLESLSLTGNVGVEGVRALLDSERLPALRSLRLSHCGIGDEHVESLRSHPRVATLAHLYLGSSGLTAPIELGSSE